MKFVCEKYPYLTFYVKGERKHFANGVYMAKTDEEKEVLSHMRYVNAIDSEVESDPKLDGDTNGDGKLTIDEIKVELDKRGIDYKGVRKRDELLALLEGE